MQEYEQHLIGLGGKRGTKKECFHPYKKKKGRGGMSLCSPGYVLSTHASTLIHRAITFLPPSARGSQRRLWWPQRALPRTHPALSSSSLLNDPQTNVLASSHLGQKQITVSETPLDYFTLTPLQRGNRL